MFIDSVLLLRPFCNTVRYTISNMNIRGSLSDLVKTTTFTAQLAGNYTQVLKIDSFVF